MESPSVNSLKLDTAAADRSKLFGVNSTSGLRAVAI